MPKPSKKQKIWQKPLFQLKLGGRVFSPSIVPTLGFLLLLPVLLRLGVWQLDRADEKHQLISDLKQQSQAQAIPLAKALKQEKPDMMPVTSEGRLIPNITLVTDNQTKNGRLGYEVYGLWQAKNVDKPIIISRGWLPRKDFYQKVPQIPAFEGNTVEGSLYYSKGHNPVVANNAEWQQFEGVWLIGQFDFQTLAEKVKQMGYDSAPFIIRLKADDNSEFVRQWELIASPPEKHIAYAIQWFAMALALVLLFIILNLKRVKNNESTSS
ncbi:SURF1 family protein [Kangiella spongicola]|uniref:SURF1 family protein n=1 Tax=Kangiella spongicola TaxID=796379 RepID=UPI001D0DDB7A|nr:SURF1 family protein [Kangiella spongicola]